MAVPPVSDVLVGGDVSKAEACHLVGAEWDYADADQAWVDSYRLGNDSVKEIILHLFGGNIKSNAADHKHDDSINSCPE